MMNRFHEIAAELRQDIANGTFRSGTALPAETQLAQRFGASVPTVRQALGLLQNEGLVEKRPGNGNFVLPPFHRLTYTGNRSARDHLHLSPSAAGLTVNVTSEEIKADDALSAYLHVPAGTPLHRYVYLSHQGTSPHSRATVYVPRTLTANLALPQTGRAPLGNDILARLADLGIHPTSTIERITARLPHPSEVRLLRLGPNTPVLAIERRSLDAADQVIEAADLVLPGHRADALFRTHTRVVNGMEAS